MNFAFYGLHKFSIVFADLLSEAAKQNTSIKITGVFARNTTSTVNAAIKINTKAYASFDDLIKEADVIVIGYGDDSLGEISMLLKEKGVKNKILCHFSTEYNSSILSCGTTNTCYSINFPFLYETVKAYKSVNPTITFEGGGRRHDEFKALMEENLKKCIFCSRNSRELSLIAKRATTVLVPEVIDVFEFLYKASDIYDKEEYINLVLKSIADRLREKPLGTASPKTTEDGLKKNIRVLNALGEPEMKELYKQLELYTAENTHYNQEDKYRIRKILNKKK